MIFKLMLNFTLNKANNQYLRLSLSYLYFVSELETVSKIESAVARHISPSWLDKNSD